MADKCTYYLKEISEAFGMNVKQFAQTMGYSRQALYQAACGISNLDKRRLAVSQYKLDKLNEKLRDAEMAACEERFNDRAKLIDSLIDRLGG